MAGLRWVGWALAVYGWHNSPAPNGLEFGGGRIGPPADGPDGFGDQRKEDRR